MRLKRFDSSRIKVRGGNSGSGRSSGQRAMLGGGSLGLGGLVMVVIAVVVFGADPAAMLGDMTSAPSSSAPATNSQTGAGQSTMSEEAFCTQNPYATESCNALNSLNDTWEPTFARNNARFEQPELVFYSGATRSGCGAASSATGPFYCPADLGIYIDTSFYDVLARQLGAGGDFARYYVMAHEYGHHVQNMTGTARRVREEQRRNPAASNRLQVAMELQADCYAGVWAAKNRQLIEPGDMEEGLRAASAIGDDTLQRGAGQQVNPESFTHGSSAQRSAWLKRGLDSGDPAVCDTFGGQG